jgi:hypothetical protein
MSEDTPGGAALVPGYAGHGDARARHLSDQQVRAWVGEQLADLQERLAVEDLREQLDALLLRCEFADQHVVHAIEDDRFALAEFAAAIEDYDRKLIEAAAACSTVAAAEILGLIEAIESAFAERSAGIAARLKR